MGGTTGIAAGDITLGILAGGRASRLGGLDKAWLERDGIPQVLRWRDRFAAETGAVLVSANRGHERLAAHGLHAVPTASPMPDRWADWMRWPLPADAVGVHAAGRSARRQRLLAAPGFDA